MIEAGFVSNRILSVIMHLLISVHTIYQMYTRVLLISTYCGSLTRSYFFIIQTKCHSILELVNLCVSLSPTCSYKILHVDHCTSNQMIKYQHDLNNMILNNMILNNMILNNMILNNMILNNMILNNMIRNNMIRNNIILNNMILNNMILNNMILNNMVLNNMILSNMISTT